MWLLLDGLEMIHNWIGLGCGCCCWVGWGVVVVGWVGVWLLLGGLGCGCCWVGKRGGLLLGGLEEY